MIPSKAEGRAGSLDHRLRHILDTGSRSEAAERRRREHWLKVQAAATGTLGGILLDLGERGVPVVLTTTRRRTVHGVIRTLGRDFLGLRTPDGAGLIVAMHALTAIRAEPGTPPSAGDRLVQLDANLAEVLANLADDRPHVLVRTADGANTHGRLVTAGLDVVSLAVGTERSTTYLPLAAVTEVVTP